jgi:hypothetical protein
MIYLYIFGLIVLLIFIYNNRSQIIYEEFSSKKKPKKIKKKIIIRQPIKSDRVFTKIEINNMHKNNLMHQKNAALANINQQNVVLDKSRNNEYTNAEQVKINNYYKLLMKDKVETKIRNNSEKKECITHIKPKTVEVINQYGYSYLPPEVWSVPQDRPPVCIPQMGYKAEAVPLYTVGTPIDALEISNTILPKFTYNEVYDPKYYYPGYQSR